MKDAGDVNEPEPQDGRARLRAELLALGRGLEVPGDAGLTMAEQVLARIVAEGVPAPATPGRRERARVWVRRRARLLAAALSGLLVVLVLTPPVRAAVMDWFDFGGVEVRYDPSGPAAGRAGGPVPGCAAEPVAPARAGELGHTVEQNDDGVDTLPDLKVILSNESSFEYPVDEEGDPVFFDYVLVTSVDFRGPRGG